MKSAENAELLSARAISSVIRGVYPTGPRLFRLLQVYRPRICPFERLLPWVPKGSEILDVGCGGGLWLHLLARLGVIRSGVGFDSSHEAIALANGALNTGWKPDQPAEHRPGLRFEHLDVRADWPAPGAGASGGFDVVSIIDVMHHVPRVAQRSVIERAAHRLRPGGVLIYKDMCRRPIWRATMNRLHDLVMAKQWINYCPIEEVEAWAGQMGLVRRHASTHNRLWYGHELRVFVKAEGAA
ncbi:MAG: class I SAM-dependent methyltransferase [Phycisphaerales bacterium]|nr:class I SAM-dependent methyltransferase [Phycisphaerales bacterium]